MIIATDRVNNAVSVNDWVGFARKGDEKLHIGKVMSVNGVKLAILPHKEQSLVIRNAFETVKLEGDVE